jgi:hypothetical protein
VLRSAECTLYARPYSACSRDRYVPVDYRHKLCCFGHSVALFPRSCRRRMHCGYALRYCEVAAALYGCIALLCIASHCIASHCFASHPIPSDCFALHHIASHCIALHRIASHRIALHARGCGRCKLTRKRNRTRARSTAPTGCSFRCGGPTRPRNIDGHPALLSGMRAGMERRQVGVPSTADRL